MAMKGQWKTVESIIGGLVILLFVATLSATYSQPPSTAPAQGYRALQAVYELGGLRANAAALDAAAINAEVAATGYMAGYNHTVRICDPQGTCTGQAPGSSDVWVSSILLAGDGSYQPVEVILYAFRN